MTHRQASGRSRRRDPADVLADRLHAAAIHLLRRLRREDDAAGLSAPRLSALSVVVFGGPITIGALAAAEQVRAPTMSRLVAALEAQGLVRRVPDRTDHRIVRVEATTLGRALLQAGRRRRVDVLTADIRKLSAAERRALTAAIPLFERLAGR
ncbi:MAG TPA: MarR family transcriptional regulator [Gemmatimonadaceae bacterium]|nr:MarR family transcriptional regulator [Gemmatimonadaceae bacterium]